MKHKSKLEQWKLVSRRDNLIFTSFHHENICQESEIMFFQQSTSCQLHFYRFVDSQRNWMAMAEWMKRKKNFKYVQEFPSSEFIVSVIRVEFFS